MKNFWNYFLLGMSFSLLLGLVFLFFSGRKKPTVLSNVKLESAIPTEVPAPTPTSTPTPTPTPIPTSVPTIIPTPTVVPTPTPLPLPPVSPEEVHGFIERFAAQYNVDPNVLRHIAVCESGFNPSAAKLSYAGLFQFGPTAWGKYRNLMGEDASLELRFNAEEAAQTAAYVLSINEAYIWPNCLP